MKGRSGHSYAHTHISWGDYARRNWGAIRSRCDLRNESEGKKNAIITKLYVYIIFI